VLIFLHIKCVYKPCFLFCFSEELGDFNPEEHVGNYVADLKILLKQTTYIEEKMMEFHEKLKDQTPEQVETAFLRKAACLDTYGVDPQPVKVRM
jgi:FERM central domain.